MISNISPLRYPGGKKKLTPFFTSVIKNNNFGNITYIEPYAGGAGAALNLLLLEYVNDIVINDADYCIYCFWDAIINNTNNFIERIKRTNITINTWKRQKNILDSAHSQEPFKVGFATFFLNRCNRSGIIDAGPIGGMQQKGKWKVDARFNKKELIERIRTIGFYKNRIKLYNLDAIEFLKIIKSNYNNSEVLIYLDPPYYIEGKNLYLNYYTNEDHAKLSKFLDNDFNYSWILSYDNIREINELYIDKIKIEYSLNYSANTKKKGREVMFFSDNIQIPQHTNIL